MINIKNTQKKVKLDIEKIYNYIKQILKLLKYDDFDIGIWFTNNKTISIYNKKYLNKDKPTDILSFPFHTTLIAGEKIKVKDKDDKNLGDLLISPEYIKVNTEKLNIPFDQRLREIIVHGICHLLGYDHIKDSDWKKMRSKEKWLLNKLKS